MSTDKKKYSFFNCLFKNFFSNDVQEIITINTDDLCLEKPLLKEDILEEQVVVVEEHVVVVEEQIVVVEEQIVVVEEQVVIVEEQVVVVEEQVVVIEEQVVVVEEQVVVVEEQIVVEEEQSTKNLSVDLSAENINDMGIVDETIFDNTNMNLSTSTIDEKESSYIPNKDIDSDSSEEYIKKLIHE